MRLCFLLVWIVLPLSLPAQETSAPLAPLLRLLATSDDAELHGDVLRGLHEALRGRRNVPPPPGWAAVQAKLAKSANPEVREKALLLSVIFGDAQALQQLRAQALDGKTELTSRRQALQTLNDIQDPQLRLLLEKLLDDRDLRGQAMRGLASFSDAKVPVLILQHYPDLSAEDKTDALATLSSRGPFALALLDAVAAKRIPRADLSAFTVRQIASLKDKQVMQRLTEVWGVIRPTSQDKAALMTKYQAIVAPDALKKADRVQGRVLFNKICANCHKLFGEGGSIGPELTGSQRSSTEYLLTKILDPSATVSKDYQVSVLGMKDGRVLNGIVKEETPQTLTLQTATELLRLAVKDVDSRKLTGQSLMPEGALAPLTDREVRDLIAYLAGAEQVKLPK